MTVGQFFPVVYPLNLPLYHHFRGRKPKKNPGVFIKILRQPWAKTPKHPSAPLRARSQIADRDWMGWSCGNSWMFPKMWYVFSFDSHILNRSAGLCWLACCRMGDDFTSNWQIWSELSITVKQHYRHTWQNCSSGVIFIKKTRDNSKQTIITVFWVHGGIWGVYASFGFAWEWVKEGTLHFDGLNFKHHVPI